MGLLLQEPTVLQGRKESAPRESRGDWPRGRLQKDFLEEVVLEARGERGGQREGGAQPSEGHMLTTC